MSDATLTIDASRTSGEPHTEDVVNAALMELALAGGSAKRAEARLHEKGIEVPRQTLERWRDDVHAVRYIETRDDRAAQVQRVIAAEHEDLAIQGAQLTRELIQRTKERIAEIPDRDLPGALRNAATSAAISTDKALMARERPVAMPAASRSVDELMAALIGVGVAQKVEAGQQQPAIDVADAE